MLASCLKDTGRNAIEPRTLLRGDAMPWSLVFQSDITAFIRTGVIDLDMPKPARFSLKNKLASGGESVSSLRSAFNRSRLKRRNILPAEPQIEKKSVEHLKIGLFSESFHPIQNGVTTSVLTLVSELRSLGHHVWVFAPEHGNLHEPETNVVRFPSFITQFNSEYPLAYPFLPRMTLKTHLEKLKMDVVHTHTPFILGLTGADLAIERGIPLISTFHTLYSQYSHYITFLPEAFTQGILEAFIPWYYNRCTMILCPSKSTAAYLKQQGVSRPIEVIPTGVPLPANEVLTLESRMNVRKSLGIEIDTPLALYAGRLAPEKNLDWLLEVFFEVRRRSPSAKLAFAGGGNLMETLQAHASQLGIEGSVLFLGAKSRAEMDGLYAAADVFCFPSPSETQGLVVGEARAAGTPVVVIDSGGAPETVQHGEDGFRVAMGDTETFADRILSLLEDRALRERFSANCLLNARKHTPQMMAQKVLEVYRKVGAGESETYAKG